MVNCRRSVVVHSIPHLQLFAARRCSCAWCISMLLWLAALIVPFIVAFCYNGWWFNQFNQRVLVTEKPQILAVKPAFASLTLQPEQNQSGLYMKNRAYPVDSRRLVWTRGHRPKQLFLVGHEWTEVPIDKVELHAPQVTASLGGTEGDVIDFGMSWELHTAAGKTLPGPSLHPHGNSRLITRVTHCRIGLEVVYALQSFPGEQFQSTAVVSESSNSPASGMALEATLVLQQHTPADITTAKSQNFQEGFLSQYPAPDASDEKEATRLEDQSPRLLASTKRIQWNSEPPRTDREQFEASLSLTVLTLTVARKPTVFEVGVTAWVRYFVLAFPCVKIMKFLKSFLFAGRYVTTYSISTVSTKEI